MNSDGTIILSRVQYILLQFLETSVQHTMQENDKNIELVDKQNNNKLVIKKKNY